MEKCKVCGKEKELDRGICNDCWNEPFEITSVCRRDLEENYTPEQIAKVEMARLASKMADAYCDNGFWTDLEIIVDLFLEEE